MSPSPALTTIGFDADDTLWQNERYYRLTEERFTELLTDHAGDTEISKTLLAASKRNLQFYGFGIKGFTLSMIETALEVTGGQVATSVISEILAIGRQLLRHPIETLPGVQDTLAALASSYTLIMITKGDLFDQERKLAQSGLGDFFDAIEIVSDKTPETYTRIFARHGDGPERAMMVGNSLKSDVIPALLAGAWGVFVPHPLTWAHEHAEPPVEQARFRELTDLGGLPPLITAIASGG